ncbi:MAG: hypothetical protein L6R40_003774 [Gallowayella cf. fulva]|nr:MAG: hypothetical protein L6R40_003774 [Xanthomendoza cf. fulva]
MKTDFKFSNLLGTVYCKGNLVFTPDGNSLLSPVGNRVSIFNLVQNSSYTLPFAHRRNISHLALSPDGLILLSASDGGLDFAPFVRHRVLAGHNDVVQAFDWSSDSRFFLSSGKDLLARIWSLDSHEDFTPTALGGHKEAVIGAWFSTDQETIYTVARDGSFFQWHYTSLSDDFSSEQDAIDDINRPMGWRIAQRHYLSQLGAKLSCATFHASSNLLIAGFTSGLFGLYELPDFNMIHTLSISQQAIDDVAINRSGEWLALGASKLGQLLVWEWQSESYILKQQGHFDSMNDLVYSRDGNRIVTAADDGKIKVWDTKSGFCIVTFTEHSSGVTACKFAQKGNVLFSASLDGSVRAWDLTRYRNFRTFSAPTRLSFSSLAVDPSGDVVCAGSLGSFDIHIWSVQTGQLLDQLAGHEGPISSLAFAPSGGLLISGSWDHTVRIWNIFDRTQSHEALQLQADITEVAIRPDSKQIAVATLDGQLTFWSVSEGAQEANLDGRRDASGGRKVSDRRTAANAAGTKSFNCISYSMDGSCILAGGNSKYVCLYDVLSGSLVKKFTVSVNMALEGTQEYLNSRTLIEAGPAGLLDNQGEASDLEDRIDRSLPGSGRGDLSSRRTRPEVRVTAIAFSPTGGAFCAASTEGLLVYSLDSGLQFDPFDLDIDVTPTSTLQALEEKLYLQALIMGFRLNEGPLLKRVFEAIPPTETGRLVKQMPTVYIARLIRFVAQITNASPRLESNLRWIEALLSTHGFFLKNNMHSFTQELRMVQKVIGSIQVDLARVADENTYILDYVLNQSADGSGNLDSMLPNGA